MNFLEIQKEYAQLRGELQNGSITGMNSDEISLMKTFINREIKELAEFKPPHLYSEWHIRLQPATTLMSGGLNTITGTKDIPVLNDTSAKLKVRDTFRLAENGTYRRRIISVSGSSTTLNVDHSLAAAATTATKWVAYRDIQPLPHNVGLLNKAFYEDGEAKITLIMSREKFAILSKRPHTSSKPEIACIHQFTNRFATDRAEYVFSSACTVLSGSRVVTMKNTQRVYPGDVCVLDTSTTESLHTIAGVSSTTGQGTFYLDREWAGASKGVTMYCNPREYTDYISLWPFPTDEEDVIIKGWLRPHDMVYDEDECILPDHLCYVVVIGALLKDKFGMEIVTNEWLEWYKRAKKQLAKKMSAEDMNIGEPPNYTGRWGGEYPSFMSSWQE